MAIDRNQSLERPHNGTAPVAGSTLFSSYYFWYSFSPYRRCRA
ncbi:MAG TPA: hypothetical protein PLL20_09265 [Phycisphaerae bacterium]|nr:hypothetical protein [Phycisphaerae bacterium]